MCSHDTVLPALQAKAYSESASVDQNRWNAATREMRTCWADLKPLGDERHPTTLQTLMMLGEVSNSYSQHYDPGYMMEAGYEHAVDHQDPAMAVQHLTFCMFHELKVTCLNPAVAVHHPTFCTFREARKAIFPETGVILRHRLACCLFHETKVMVPTHCWQAAVYHYTSCLLHVWLTLRIYPVW